MTTIKRSILISAQPIEVFNFIADVEGIPKFSTSITKVTQVSDNNYYWKADIAGMELEWNSEIVKKDEPNYLSWHSISGMENRGEYRLEPQDGQTKITFFMEYHLPSRIIEMALHTVFYNLIDEMFARGYGFSRFDAVSYDKHWHYLLTFRDPYVLYRD